MRTEQVLVSLMALLMSFLLVGGGLYLFIFPDTALNHHTIALSCMGGGFSLLLIFFLLSRRRYLLIQMGGVEIHETLVRHFAKEALQELFPYTSIGCDAIIHRKGKVEILANIPYLSEERREQMLEEIERRLSVALAKYCGCKGPFLFNVSFS